MSAGWTGQSKGMRRTAQTPEHLHDRLVHALAQQHYGRASQIADQITRRMLAEPTYPKGILTRHLRALRGERLYDDYVRIASTYAVHH